MQLESIREQLVKLHLELPRNNLVTWTSGNVSIRDAASGLVVIKPSGITYEDLRAEHFVILDVNGKVVEGSLKPSSDTASHLYIYRHRPDVFGVVHTHSPYATAFAAIGKSVPVYLTAQADEFGGSIPCAGRKYRRIFSLFAEEPRRLHHRPQRQGSGQSRRDGRGCLPHHLDRASARPTG
jgi:L-ribulose-5-phosphate 4-epimerase